MDNVAINYANKPLGTNDSIETMLRVRAYLAKELTKLCEANATIDYDIEFDGPTTIYRKVKEEGKWFRRREILIRIHDKLVGGTPNNYFVYSVIEVHKKSVEDIVSRALAIYYGRFPGVPLPSFYKMYEEDGIAKDGQIIRVEINYSQAKPADHYLYESGLTLKS